MIRELENWRIGELGGKVSEEGFDLRDAHFVRMAFVVEEDILANPVGIASPVRRSSVWRGWRR